LREYLTGYFFIAPAMLLIFTFGIFPVGFALYVSVHKWLILRGELRNLRNYVEAVDNFAYLVLFALGIGALVGAGYLLRRLIRQAREDEASPWVLAIPAAFHAAALLAFLRWLYFQLPEFLDIATKMRGLERTRELFTTLLTEAFRAETVLPAWRQFVLILLIAIAAGIGTWAWRRLPDNPQYQARFSLMWLAAAIGTGLLYYTYSYIRDVYAAAVETGIDPGIWPQLVMIVSGVLLLVAAWFLWRSAEGQASNRQFAVRIFGAIPPARSHCS
jgi:multiple sugar transport system permease protein